MQIRMDMGLGIRGHRRRRRGRSRCTAWTRGRIGAAVGRCQCNFCRARDGAAGWIGRRRRPGNVRFRFGARQHHIARSFHSAHLRFALLDVLFGTVVHVQAQEGKADPESLHRMDGLSKPDNGNADDDNTLDERCNRVGNR